MLRTSHTANLAARGRTSLLRGQRTDSRRTHSRGIYSHLAQFEPLESRQLLTATVIQVSTTADTVDPADGVISLREAILESNASPADNEIQLPAGTYTLTRKGANEDGALTGDLDIVNNGSLKIVGASSASTIVDASGLFDAGSGYGDSIFDVLPKPAVDHVLPNSVVEFQGLTFTNAKANGLGGAIKAKQSQMTIVDCNITNSTSNAASRGVVYLEFGSLEINNTNFSNNTGGGALVVRDANAQLLGCTFADNTGGTVVATSNPHTPNTLLIENSDFLDNSNPSDGGAIVAIFIDASIHESRFERNVAGSYGGAISTRESTLVVEDVVISDNTAINGGGGIFSEHSALTLTNSSILRNVSAGGGGILSLEDHGRTIHIVGTTIEGNHSETVGGGVAAGIGATIENSTISGNSASQSGGGLIGYWTVRNSTITGNRADSDGNGDGSGGGIWSPGGAGGLTIFNSIVAGNVTGLVGADIANDLKLAQGTAAPTSTFNLIGDPNSAGGLIHGANGNIVGDGSGNLLDIHTVLDTTLADNGGPTLTHALMLGSPALNAGDPLFDPNATNPPIDFDQRGAGFARVKNGRLDIGAFEGLHDPAPVDGLIVVTTLDDVIDSEDGLWSLREAVIYANSHAEDNVIQLAPGTYTLTRKGANEDSALTGDLDIVNNGSLKIVGASSGTTTVDASGLFDAGLGRGDRVFDVLTGASFRMEHLTITGGNTTASGGGIQGVSALIEIVESAIVNNTAGEGGGIYSRNSMLTVSGTTIAGNSAGSGGGVFNEQRETNPFVRNSQATITSSTIRDNEAVRGGGLYNGGQMSIVDSKIEENSAKEGGGIAAFGPTGGSFPLVGELSIQNSTVSGNTATDVGGGILDVAARIAILNCDIHENTAKWGGGLYLYSYFLLTPDGEATISNSRFVSNTAEQGGGIYLAFGRIALNDSTVSHNSAQYGGGIFYRGTPPTSLRVSELSIVRSTLSENTASIDGGGVYGSSRNAIGFTNSTISGNRAAGNGGGFFSASDLGAIRNSTFTGNRADSDGDGNGTGGGIYLFSQNPTLTNSILAGNLRGATEAAVASDIEAQAGSNAQISPNSSYNIIGDPTTAGGLVHGVNGNIVGDGGGNVLDIHTVLDTTLADNGGPTLTHALVPGSLALDAGNPQFNPNTDPPAFLDQRGAGYGRVSGGRVDIGAVEAGATFQSIVSGRHIFYDDSAFDNNSPGVNPLDVFATATDKQPLLPNGSLATAANATNFASGITGIMIDLAGSHPDVTAADFLFHIGNNNLPGTWAVAPPPATVTVLAGQGVSGSDRVVITWPAGAIKNTWLEVQVLATAQTGLAASDVFYWGNKVADSFTGSGGRTFETTTTDAAQVYSNLGPYNASGGFFGPTIENPRDYNRDGQITSTDAALVYANIGSIVRLSIPAMAAPQAQVATLGPSTGPTAAVANRDDGRSAIASALARPVAARTAESPVPAITSVGREVAKSDQRIAAASAITESQRLEALNAASDSLEDILLELEEALCGASLGELL